jgi:putative transposase
MARPLRYEAAGAVYHVMARGDGGKHVFEEDKDCDSWLDLLGRVHERFGWRTHAWVLMGNHFHILLETPEPNLVAGMKWFLGVFSQGWNRRRQRRGHVFQGRYKAVVVNGEEREGCYFRIVADYIHLNPVRAGMVGGETGRRLRTWRWSSFAAYAGSRIPEWLETGRVLRAFQVSEDGHGGKAYAGYLEARSKERKGGISDAALAELRRGWYLGGKGFAAKILESLATATHPKRRKGSVGGAAALAHDAAEAEKIVAGGLSALGMPEDAAKPLKRGKWRQQKTLLAALVRQRTGVGNAWVAARLGMGHEMNVTRATRRAREDRATARLLSDLASKLGL